MYLLYYLVEGIFFLFWEKYVISGACEYIVKFDMVQPDDS